MKKQMIITGCYFGILTLLFTAWLLTTLNSQVDTRNGWNLGRPSPKVILNDGSELLFTGIREQ